MCCQAKILAQWFEYFSQDHSVVAAFIISNEQKENGSTEKLSKLLKITQLETGRDSKWVNLAEVYALPFHGSICLLFKWVCLIKI